MNLAVISASHVVPPTEQLQRLDLLPIDGERTVVPQPGLVDPVFPVRLGKGQHVDFRGLESKLLQCIRKTVGVRSIVEDVDLHAGLEDGSHQFDVLSHKLPAGPDHRFRPASELLCLGLLPEEVGLEPPQHHPLDLFPFRRGSGSGNRKGEKIRRGERQKKRNDSGPVHSRSIGWPPLSNIREGRRAVCPWRFPPLNRPGRTGR